MLSITFYLAALTALTGTLALADNVDGHGGDDWEYPGTPTVGTGPSMTDDDPRSYASGRHWQINAGCYEAEEHGYFLECRGACACGFRDCNECEFSWLDMENGRTSENAHGQMQSADGQVEYTVPPERWHDGEKWVESGDRLEGQIAERAVVPQWADAAVFAPAMDLGARGAVPKTTEAMHQDIGDGKAAQKQQRDVTETKDATQDLKHSIEAERAAQYAGQEVDLSIEHPQYGAARNFTVELAIARERINAYAATHPVMNDTQLLEDSSNTDTSTSTSTGGSSPPKNSPNQAIAIDYYKAYDTTLHRLEKAQDTIRALRWERQMQMSNMRFSEQGVRNIARWVDFEEETLRRIRDVEARVMVLFEGREGCVGLVKRDAGEGKGVGEGQDDEARERQAQIAKEVGMGMEPGNEGRRR